MNSFYLLQRTRTRTQPHRKRPEHREPEPGGREGGLEIDGEISGHPNLHEVEECGTGREGALHKHGQVRLGRRACYRWMDRLVNEVKVYFFWRTFS